MPLFAVALQGCTAAPAQAFRRLHIKRYPHNIVGQQSYDARTSTSPAAFMAPAMHATTLSHISIGSCSVHLRMPI